MHEPSKPGGQLIVFDLDGTLVDTFDDIAAAANHALAALGRSTLDPALVKSYVGGGGRKLMHRCLGGGDDAPEDLIDRAFESWRAYYLDHPVDFSRPYDGVAETLAQLRRMDGLSLAVLSNKADDLVQEILKRLGLAQWFDAIQGEAPSLPKKPDPALLRQLMTRFGASADTTLMVGDGEPDMDLARNAGVAAVGVGYGLLAPRRLRELGATRVVDEFPGLVAVVADWRAGRSA